MPVLDRRPSKPHPRRLTKYNVARYLIGGAPVAELKPRSYTWRLWERLNQGRQGACVTHTKTHEALAKPKPVDFRMIRLPAWAPQARWLQEAGRTSLGIAQQFAFEFYLWARRNDEFPGEADEGTSADAGARGMVDAGLWGGFVWSQTVRDFATAVSRHGPGCIAVDWHTGMMRPDVDGYIRPTGPVEGGHEILTSGIRVTGLGAYDFDAVLEQSWGDRLKWRIRGGDLAQLTEGGNGEMVLPTSRLIPRLAA